MYKLRVKNNVIDTIDIILLVAYKFLFNMPIIRECSEEHMVWK